MRCIRCHRPLTRSFNGMGSKCYAKAGKEIPTVERDLLGFDIPAAAAAARERVRVHIEMAAVDALMAIRHQANAARRRLGLWSAA